MRYGRRGTRESDFDAHDVSILEAIRCGVFARVSTISISPPHSGQVGGHSSSLAGAAAHLVRLLSHWCLGLRAELLLRSSS